MRVAVGFSPRGHAPRWLRRGATHGRPGFSVVAPRLVSPAAVLPWAKAPRLLSRHRSAMLHKQIEMWVMTSTSVLGWRWQAARSARAVAVM